ncbi:Fic family protein [Acinetobacter rudis]|uniref:Fic family protein n=1 Tax=Acinetobacter rudis TaxID=632955 RepID=UPI0035BE8EC0
MKPGQREYNLIKADVIIGFVTPCNNPKNYLNPALKAGLIQHMLPDKLKGYKQKYNLKK